MDKYFIEDHLVLVVLTAAIFQILALYLIINIATKTDRRAKYEWAQLDLLGKMARAQGVPEKEIEATFQAIK